MKTSILTAVYTAALAHFGHRKWWPAESAEEVIIGAVLTQNTAWTNVEKALANLRAANALSLKTIAAMPTDELAQVIRPSGYYNIKAKRLQSVARFFMAACGGRLALLQKRDPLEMRGALLAVHGAGRETADSILLYALQMPIFVVDAYTIRVLSRHGLIAPTATYEEVREFVESHFERSAPLYNDLHAQFVSLGNRYCRPKQPLCGECPLFDPALFATRGHFRACRALAKPA